MPSLQPIVTALAEARDSAQGFWKYLENWKNPFFEYLDYGSTRYVFRHKNKGYVIKVAREEYHKKYNENEYNIYRKNGKAKQLARCRLMKDHTFLVMEELSSPQTYLEVLKDSEIRTFDALQGGFDKKGRPVFYDYAAAEL